TLKFTSRRAHIHCGPKEFGLADAPRRSVRHELRRLYVNIARRLSSRGRDAPSSYFLQRPFASMTGAIQIMSAKRLSMRQKINNPAKNIKTLVTREAVTNVQFVEPPSSECRNPTIMPDMGLKPSRSWNRAGM